MEDTRQNEQQDQLVRLPMFEAWLKKTSEEFNRKMAEINAAHAKSQAEAEARKAEADARHAKLEAELKELGKFINETGKIVRETNKAIGDINNSIGELVETLLSAHAERKFESYGYVLENDSQRVKIRDDNRQVVGEIDLLLTNIYIAMAVEIKRKLDSRRQVRDHLARLKLARKYPPKAIGDKRIIGAMAGGLVDPDVSAFAYSKGLFVLELTGESVELVPPPAGFVPAEW